MKEIIKKAISLCVVFALVFTLAAPGIINANPEISITDAQTKLGDKSSNRDVYTKEEWEKIFPEGTFILEYSEYTAYEGGDDLENPSDSYLAVNVIRMGGNNSRSSVTFGATALTSSEDDIEITNNTLTFLPGEEMQTAYIKIKDNQINEHERFFSISLLTATVGHIGQMNNAMVCIKDNEKYIETTLELETKAVFDRSEGNAEVILTRSEEQSAYVFSVNLKTIDISAVSDIDYMGTETIVAFGSGEAEKTIKIPLLQTPDTAPTNPLEFKVELSNPKGGKIAEGSHSTVIKVTDEKAETTNPIHNTELMLESLGENNLVDEISVDNKDVTENLESHTLNTNAGMVDNNYLLRNALSAFSGTPVIQPFNTKAVTWDDKMVLNHTSLYGDPNWPGYHEDTNNKGTVEYGNFKYSKDNENMTRNSKRFDANWFKSYSMYIHNHTYWGLGGEPNTKFYFGNSSLVNFENFECAFKTYTSKNIGTNDAGETWTQRFYELGGEFLSGPNVKNTYFGLALWDVSGTQETNNLTMGPLNLYRTSIPYNNLFGTASKGNTDFNRNGDTITFKITETKDGINYTYDCKIERNGDGGFANTGIYVGSGLKITVTPSNDSTHNIIKKIHLKDKNNKAHIEVDLTPDGIGNFVGTTTLETHISNFTSWEWMSSETADAAKYYWDLNAPIVKQVSVNVANAKKIDNNILDGQFVKFNGATTVGLEKAEYNENDTIFNYGLRNFTSMTLDFSKIDTLGAYDVYTNIPGNEVIMWKEGRQALTLNFGVEMKSLTNIDIMLVSHGFEKLKPNFNFNDYGTEQFKNGSWPEKINKFGATASSISFETIHEYTQSGGAEGRLSFAINVGNIRGHKDVSAGKYQMKVFSVDSDGLNETHLFDFEHDTAKETPGTTTESMESMELTNVNKRFFDEGKQKPIIMLERTESNRVIYRVYLPSSHDYADSNEYVTLLTGRQNIEIKMDDRESENIDARIAYQSKSRLIQPKLIKDTLKADDQETGTEKTEGQDDLYVYKEDTSDMTLPALDFDLAPIWDLLGGPGGVSPGMTLGENEIVVTLSINGTPLKSENQKAKDYDAKEALKKVAEGNKSGSGLEPLSGTSKSSALNIGGGFSVTIKYNKTIGAWEFAECYMVVSAAGSFSIDYPLPPFPLVFLSFGVGGGLEVGTGFKSVPKKFKDGAMERQIIFSGISLSPSGYVSIGVGVGIPNLITITASGYIRAGLKATFAQTNAIENFGDFDINKTEKIFKFSGSKWAEQTGVTGAFNGTLLKGNKGEKFEFSLDAYKFDITGKLSKDSGIVKVSVFDTKTDEKISEKTYDASNSSDVLGARLYSFRDTVAKKVRVEVEVLEGSIYFDAIHFESNKDKLYDFETIPASLDEWNIKIGLELSIKAFIFNLNFDLVYFLLNQDGMYWGYPGSAPQPIKKWNEQKKSNRLFSSASESNIGLIPRNKEMRTFSGINVLDYFDFGASNKYHEKSIIDGTISATTTNQIIVHDGKTYKFWIDDPGESVRPDPFHANLLHFQIDNGPVRFIEDDKTLDAEFSVAVNAKGELQVVWSSFAENVKIPDNLTPAEQIKFINNNIEIKTAIISDEKVKDVKVIEDTKDGVNEINVKAVSNDTIDLVSFTKDTKGAYSANTKIDTGTTNPEFQNDMEDFMNAMYQGIPVNYITVTDKDGKSSTKELSSGMSSKFWKVGTKIVSTDITFIDNENVVLAYVSETPNAQKMSFKGSNIMMFLQYGKVTDGSVTFGEPKLIKEVFNFDNTLEEVFPNGDIPEEYETETGYAEDPVLGQVSFVKNTANGESVFYYKYNDRIQFINQSTLVGINSKQRNSLMIQTIGIDSQEFDINYTEDGRLYIIYSAVSENGYDNQLMLRFYDTETNTWTYPIQISYGHAFNEEALEKEEATGRISFENLSSSFTNSGDTRTLQIMAKASYIPFNYMKILDLDNEEETIPYLNELDKSTKRSLVQLSVNDTKATLSGSPLELEHNMFINGKTNVADFSISNIGTETINNPTIELRTARGVILSKDFQGELLPGDSLSLDKKGDIWTWEFDIANDFIHNDILYYVVTENGKTIYNSQDEENTYTVDMNRAELELATGHIEWASQKESGNQRTSKASYTAQVNNIGHIALAEDVNIVFEAMIEDEESLEMIVDKTKGDNGVLHIRKLTKEEIDNQNNEVLYNLSGDFELPTDLSDKYFSIRMRIEYGIAHVSEYEMFNNVSTNIMVYSPIKIVTGYEDKENILNLRIGDEVLLDDLSISAPTEGLDISDIEIYEVGTNFLSIDQTSYPARFKVMRSDKETGVVQARIAFNLKGTQITTTLFVNIDRTKVVNFPGDPSEVTLSNLAQKITDDPATSVYKNVMNNDYVSNPPSPMKEGEENSYSITVNIEKGRILYLYGLGLGDGNINFIATRSDNQKHEKNISWNQMHLEPTCVYEYLLDPEYSYTVEIISTTKNQESAIFDYLAIDGVLADLPDEEAYVVVDERSFKLDAPVQSGRKRQAEVTLTFSEAVKLKSGVSEENVMLEFDGKITDANPVERPHDPVSLKLSGISEDGKTVTFSCEVESVPESTLLYTLKNSALPPDVFVAANDERAIDPLKIPNAERIKFTVMESKISKVELIDDMHTEGQLGKSVAVDFEQVPSLGRLSGTKIAFKDEKGNPVLFEFAHINPDNARQAIYRANLALDLDENEKKYTFSTGIILSDNFALISQDNSFIDGTISVGKEIDFGYSRIKILGTPTLERVIKQESITLGEKIASKVTFDRGISISALEEKGAYIEVLRSVKDKDNKDISTEGVTLYASSINTKENSVLFVSEDNMTYKDNTVVTYSFVSTKITYSSTNPQKTIYDISNKISVNPTIITKPAPVSFNPAANILSANLMMADGFAGDKTAPVVEVLFNTEVYKASLEGSYIAVDELQTLSDGTENTVSRKLMFSGFKKAELYSGNTETTAIFTYQDGAISFAQNEEAKKYSFKADPTVVTLNGADIMSGDNNIIILPQILSTHETLASYKKAYVEETTLTRSDVSLGQEGNIITLAVKYSDAVTIKNSDLSLISVDIIKSEEGKVDTTLTLVGDAFDAESKTLKLVGKDSLYTGGAPVSYSLGSDIAGSFGNVVDSADVSVSTFVMGKTSLTIDNDKAFVESVYFDFENISAEEPFPSLKIVYPNAVRNYDELKDSRFLVAGVWSDASGEVLYEDDVEFMFDEIINDGKTLTYKVSDQQGIDYPEKWLSYSWSAAEDDLNITLVDATGSMLLDTKIPETENQSYTRPIVQNITFDNLPSDNLTTFALKDILLKADFDKNIISSEQISGIEINAVVTSTNEAGESSELDIKLTAIEVLEDKTVVFKTDSDKIFNGEQRIYISTGTEFIYSDEAGIYDAKAVKMLVFEEFESANMTIKLIDEPVIEVTTTTDESGTEPTTITDESGTEPTAITDGTGTEISPKTGEKSLGFIWIVISLMSIVFVISLAASKKRTK